MLSVESVRSSTKREREDDGGCSFLIGVDDDFAGGNCLLDDINFDDLFVGIEDGDLPDLEMDSEILAEFSSVEESTSCTPHHLLNSSPASASDESCLEEKKEKVDDNVDQESSAVTAADSASSGRKQASSTSTKVPQGKRKVKVDWTPELHRRFVQAVEQLGVDKAVPSRILELMGIDCLTRHNIASHLQKYRSHRKHLLAREAEAANWSQRRQLYGGGRGGGGGCGGVGKREVVGPWVVPTIGFLPPGAVPAQFRPLHVWGHPHPHPGAVDQTPPMVQVWPKHLVRSPSQSPPPQPWVPPAAAPPPHQPPNHHPFWLPHPHLGGSHMTHGTPYYPPPLTLSHRFRAPVPVPGIPQAMFKADANVYTFPSPGQPNSHPRIIDFHIPSKESIDAALEDVLAQPWLPLPLGLKPPSTESVLLELQRQGISKIPPSCA